MSTSKAFDDLFFRTGSSVQDSESLLEKEGLIRTIRIGSGKSYIYIGPKNGLNPIDQFKRIGATTIPVIPKDQIRDIHNEFLNTLKSFPEYNRNHEHIFYVAGGFGGLGNPSNFHNPFVRKLIQERAYPKAKEFYQQIYKNNRSLKFHAIKDRMMFRPTGKTPTAEAWHRDVIGKEVHGGWINTDSNSQYFTFIPGSHLNIDPSKIDEGFALVSKHIDPKELKPYQYRIEIPPGHMIIFPQYIIHTVESKKQNYDITRLFTGWVLTESDKSLYLDSDGNDRIDQILNNQEVPPLPGGMIPPLFSPNHYNFLFKPFSWGNGIKMTLTEWAEQTFKPEILIEKYSKTHNKSYIFIPRYMKSLKEYNFELYPSYSEDEKALYKPSKLNE